MKTKLFLYKSCGFTALDVTIATIIVSLFAALTLPRLPAILENKRVSVAKKVLYDLYTAQKRYFLDNNQYAGNISALDIPLTKFPPVYAVDVANNAARLASLTNNSKSYALFINSAGEINCDGEGCGQSFTTAYTAAAGGAEQIPFYTQTAAPAPDDTPYYTPEQIEGFTKELEEASKGFTDMYAASDWLYNNADKWEAILGATPEIADKIPLNGNWLGDAPPADVLAKFDFSDLINKIKENPKEMINIWNDFLASNKELAEILKDTNPLDLIDAIENPEEEEKEVTFPSIDQIGIFDLQKIYTELKTILGSKVYEELKQQMLLDAWTAFVADNKASVLEPITFQEFIAWWDNGGEQAYLDFIAESPILGGPMYDPKYPLQK
jgi:type II secretory pathway pseudopilin PulG